MEKVIIVDNKKLHLIIPDVNDVREIFDTSRADSDLWDFPIAELFDGTIEINEDIWYCLLNGRCYETDREVINN